MTSCQFAGFFAWCEISHADDLKVGSMTFVWAKAQFSHMNQLGNGRADTIVSQSLIASTEGVVMSYISEGVFMNRSQRCTASGAIDNTNNGAKHVSKYNRHSLKSLEKRNYCPWRTPSQPVDIVALTDSGGLDIICYSGGAFNAKRCEHNANNTMNFNTKGYCDIAHTAGATVQTKLAHSE